MLHPARDQFFLRAWQTVDGIQKDLPRHKSRRARRSPDLWVFKSLQKESWTSGMFLKLSESWNAAFAHGRSGPFSQLAIGTSNPRFGLSTIFMGI
jgi:hypothetical protein